MNWSFKILEELSEVEISNLPAKEFKVIITKMLNKLGRRMDEYSEMFNKELENIKKNQMELKNTITEIKNTLEGLNSRLTEQNRQCRNRLMQI